MSYQDHITLADGRRLSLRVDLIPGDLGRVTALHGELYAREYKLNHVFEAYVAESLSLFAKQYDPRRDRLWIAESEKALLGSIGIIRQESAVAQLRWFIVAPEARNIGLGSLLLDHCLEFCRAAGYEQVFLWTFDSLAAAARLYLSAGFTLTEETHATTNWGPLLVEQRYDLLLCEAQS